jgi:hypothetical protein
MRGVALGEISLVSRLLESLDEYEAVSKSAATPILEYPKDVPTFSFSYESRLLMGCYRFPLPDGTISNISFIAHCSTSRGADPAARMQMPSSHGLTVVLPRPG